jgi:excisionase family DNA binding protein
MATPQTSPSTPTSTPPNRATRRKNLTAQQAADYLNVSLRTLHNWLRDGTITGHRLGPKFLRFDADELDAARDRL